ncbi:putative ATP-dependent RNA helicase DHR1 [Lithohypha guttulata]|uniref:putative ATP-dependent RNA helicase DHR1 n=1 Tax=Lithohypha guttulata TaxID=1690604 RepID=UPI002DDDE6BD|nr:putative ATP-dependent RNA helicase DHR1 [Lithohypha guttulata]
MPSFKPTRERKHKKLARRTEGENARPSKKQRRLEKYVEKKLKHDEAKDYLRKLESQKETYNGLQSSSTLKRKFGDFVHGHVSQHESSKLQRNSSYSSEDSFDGANDDVPDPTSDFGDEPAVVADAIADDAWTRTRAPPIQGTGLAQPLKLDANGMPVIPMRQKPLPVTASISSDGSETDSEQENEDDEDDSEEEESWAGFSGSAATSSEESSENSAEEESDDETDASSNAEVDTRLKPRTSAFKSWATQQINQSIGHTPFYEQPQATPQTFEKPAAGYRLGIKETERPKDDHRAYSVHVERAESIQEIRLQLPILQKEQEIMEAVHNNTVVVLKGDTGSGKTTQLPQFLFEAGYGDKDGLTPGMIGITQPRRVAAVSMAKRVAQELGNHGDKVAHQIRFDTTVSSKTAIKFMTDGVLLRELSQDLLLKKYSAIIIDEAHERSVNTDLLIGILSKIVPARMKKSEPNPDPKPLKLIIMSATLNIKDFLHEKLFSTFMRPALVEAEGRQHRVTTHFALRSRPDYLEETVEKVKRAHKKLPRGGILVFLTGQNEIKYVLSRLRKDLVRPTAKLEEAAPRMHISAVDTPLELEDLDIGDIHTTSQEDLDLADEIDIVTDEEELDKEFEVSDDDDEEGMVDVPALRQDKIALKRDPYDTVHLLPLYSQLPTKDQLRIFEPPPERSRLIVLSTNVAETSLTIPNIRYVIDCGRSKERKFNSETNTQSFEVDYISKASAQQRAGRAGRTAPGHCWRLYSSATYEQYFPEHTEPEILRTPAENVVLSVKGFRFPKPVTDFPFPTAPTRTTLANAERLLKHLGAIAGPNGALTDLGKKMTLYPVNPRLSKIIIHAIEKAPKALNQIILLASALSVDDIFVNQTQISPEVDDDGHDDEQDKLKQRYGRAHARFSRQDKASDALKLLTAAQLYLKDSEKDHFCQQFFLRSKAMQEISQLYSQLCSMIRSTHPHLSHVLGTAQLTETTKPDVVKSINTSAASGYIDQIAIRYDLHPEQSIVASSPRRAIDVPYFPLIPINQRTGNSEKRPAFIHPSSVLAKLSTKVLPQYIVYRHLQERTNSQVLTSSDTEIVKTRMLPLCTVDATALLSLVRDTGVMSYGKPVPKTKIEDVKNTSPKERIAWVSCEMNGWPLPPSRVRQVMDVKEASGWRVVEVLA